jgi:hypothetical protein
MPTSRRLARQLKPRGHAPFATLHDASRYMLELPPELTAWNAWQSAARLAIEARERPSKAAIAAFTDQLERALFLSYPVT